VCVCGGGGGGMKKWDAEHAERVLLNYRIPRICGLVGSDVDVVLLLQAFLSRLLLMIGSFCIMCLLLL